MNQEDKTARPMFGAFTDHPDFRPYDALPSNVPLTLGAPGFAAGAASAGASGAAGAAAVRQFASVPAAERAVYRQWVAWSAHQRFNGRNAVEDAANPAQLNRLDWYAATGWRRPYPGELRILAPNQVPGRTRPALDIGTG